MQIPFVVWARFPSTRQPFNPKQSSLERIVHLLNCTRQPITLDCIWYLFSLCVCFASLRVKLTSYRSESRQLVQCWKCCSGTLADCHYAHPQLMSSSLTFHSAFALALSRCAFIVLFLCVVIRVTIATGDLLEQYRFVSSGYGRTCTDHQTFWVSTTQLIKMLSIPHHTL